MKKYFSTSAYGSFQHMLYNICHLLSFPFIAAEPTRQPTTKRRKRKNSTSSTSNSSAGNNANSTNSKKKSAAANLSLSSQVPVSLTFLLGLNHLWCFNFSLHCKEGAFLSLKYRKQKAILHSVLWKLGNQWRDVKKPFCSADFTNDPQAGVS